jgi:hypothetical protein
MNNVDDFLARKRAEREAAGIVERPTIILTVEGQPPLRYEPAEDHDEDNRRRKAAGLPERRGKWGSR